MEGKLGLEKLSDGMLPRQHHASRGSSSCLVSSSRSSSPRSMFKLWIFLIMVAIES